MTSFIDRLANTDRRTANVVVNTILSALLRAVSMLCSLAIVPLTINYLNPEVYGIWMAMTSVLYWIAFMDIGLGNGMRNQMAESFAMGDIAKASSYFTTALVYLSIIAVIIALVALPGLHFTDLQSVLNTSCLSNHQLMVVMTIAISMTLMQFVVKNIGLVYVAMQKYAVNDLILFAGNVFSLLIIYILTLTTKPNLTYVVWAFTATPVVIFCISAIPLLIKYPQLLPRLSLINNKAAKRITTKGLGFFVIQITSCLIVFGSTNIFISHFAGPEQVTKYNVAYKLFNLLIVGYTIVLAPLWNAYTEAAAKNDYEWIACSYKKSLKTLVLITLAGVVMLIASPWFFKWWVGSNVHIPTELSVAVFVYITVFNFANASAYLLNGLSILKVHIITSITVSLVYLVSVITLGNRLSATEIVAFMSVAYLVMGLVYAYQCYLVINKKATGIWSE